MKHFTAAVATVALSLALAGCSFNIKTDSAPTTSPTTTSPTTSTTTTSATTSAQAAGPNYTIADYIRDNHIQETPVHHGDPGSPTIDLPVPDDWRLLPESSRTLWRHRLHPARRSQRSPHHRCDPLQTHR